MLTARSQFRGTMSWPLRLLLLAIAVLGPAATSIACRGDLVWSDEFTGPAGTRPSAANWVFEEGDGTNKSLPGWGNQELQYYTSEAAALDGAGFLRITASAANAARYKCYYGPCKFTSARLNSLFFSHYGRFEARVKTTAALGTWPAFWMLGTNIAEVSWPECGEIDIMEARGSKPDTVSGTIHGPGYAGGKALSHSYQLVNTTSTFANDFHVVALDWLPDSLTWSVDGEPYATERPTPGRRWVFDHPFYMLINLAVGGHFGGEPSREANFTQQFVIDYIRVYKHMENCTHEDSGSSTTLATTSMATGQDVARESKVSTGGAPQMIPWVCFSMWAIVGLAFVSAGIF